VGPLAGWPAFETRELTSKTSNVITDLPVVVAEHIAAVNAFDIDRIVATFTDDAYMNDNRREIYTRSRDVSPASRAGDCNSCIPVCSRA
jgi:hypothetical protein